MLGYFIYDTIAMSMLGLLDGAILGHHMICIVGFYTTLATQISGGEIMACAFVSEISNPFMHGRQMLRDTGLRHTKAYEILESLYIFLYIYYRMIIGIFIIYGTWASGTAPYIVALMGTAIGG